MMEEPTKKCTEDGECSCGEKTLDIKDIRWQIRKYRAEEARLMEQEKHDENARQVMGVMKGLTNAGFTNQQAWDILCIMLKNTKQGIE